MKYITLKKYEYIHHGKSKDEYQHRYNSYDSTKIGVDIHSAPAFFVETKEIRKNAILIYKLDKTVSKLCNSFPVEAVVNYMLSCLIDEIQITNSIEGVHSTKKEILSAYKSKSDRFYGIVTKYRMLISSDELSLQTCQDIRSLYNELVLPEIVEESEDKAPDGLLFRKEHVFVQGNNIEPVHEGLFPEEKIIDSMTKALAFLNDEDEELLYRVAVFHYLLGYIHPFYDGNGRLNRFISSYMLAQSLEPIIGYSLSNIIKEEQSRYNKTFVECNDKDNRGELTVFVEMFMEILVESIQHLISSLESRSDSWKKYQKIIDKLPHANEKHFKKIYEELILTELFAPESIGINDLRKNSGLSEPTLRKALKTLNAAGLLKIDKSEKRYKYGIKLDLIDSFIE